MKKLFLTLSVIVALAAGACDDAVPTGPDGASFDSGRAGPSVLNVMTWNIYVGADLTQLLAVGGLEDVPCAVFGVWQDVIATDFPTRAVAIADQIEASRPHVIGLNEVSTFAFTFGSTPDLVFLDILLAELDSRGLNYDAEATSTNFQVALPIAYTDQCPAAPQDELTYTEYDVVLVRDDVETTGAANGTYAAVLPLPLPGGITLEKPSGWAFVDILHKDLPYRVFSTHLEPADIGPCTTHPDLLELHYYQALELMGILAASEVPTILTGDLNSDASGCTTATYPDLIEAGFVDAWTLGRPLGQGFTSNQADDLQNATSELFHRIDFILYRDAFTAAGGNFRGSSHAERVGEEPGDRIASSATGSSVMLWPSDHAGVVAELRIAPGRGHRK
ncbi:MAG: endonuclease/exonuclease/phosphatase family protein [Gemmatimonadetes bacterium]|nr:endonuclease/exonuclease/phosphatase family protein [Gemmatimonadota bacterium]